MKIVINVILFVVIIVFSYLLWSNIDEPIQFEKAKKKRYNVAIQKLKDIRTAELAYQAVNGEFTGSFDTLIDFVKNDSIPMVRAIGAVPDSLTEKKALELGIISRDTSFVSTLDSLFEDGYAIDSLRFVPFSQEVEFTLGAKILEVGSKVGESTLKVPVFEAKVQNRVLLKGLNRQQRINLDDEQIKMDKYIGLKVGSLEQNINNAGNWE